MRHGLVRAAMITPRIRVADPEYNAEEILRTMREAAAGGAKILVYPELAVTGYTCGDLFLQRLLLEGAREAVRKIAEESADLDMIAFVGTPWAKDGQLYSVLAVISRGHLLGMIPKSVIPNYGEFYEKRHFRPAPEGLGTVVIQGKGQESIDIPFGTDLLFRCRELPELVIAGELCEDLWAPCPPSIRHALAGATVIVNGSASDAATGKAAYRRDLVVGQSGRLLCAYLYTSAGEGESSTDLVFSGHNLAAENGALAAESKRFTSGITYAVIDVHKLEGERRRNTSFGPVTSEAYWDIPFSLGMTETELLRIPSPTPFVPAGREDWEQRCQEILSIQSLGLAKRLAHTGCRRCVIGISGGLDSTLALLVTARAFDALGLPREGILAVTMPCFGTTDRTYQNACTLSRTMGAELREIPIQNAVRQHFQDIGQEEDCHDVTYENGQARERTQVLMDLANQIGGMVIGTGDMSELALGWATYNGDHMSMYGVNVGVPKTLVRHLVRYYAETCGEDGLARALFDVLDTPVSPELLPPEDGQISQKTEDLVGPYELHDFFLYYMLRYGFPPEKIYRFALATFGESYGADTIRKWLKTFYRRFFSQQFKRSCLPDGPKVGSVAVSPRGDWRMPSDASARLWLSQAEKL